jgi:hypothetical protein
MVWDTLMRHADAGCEAPAGWHSLVCELNDSGRVGRCELIGDAAPRDVLRGWRTTGDTRTLVLATAGKLQLANGNEAPVRAVVCVDRPGGCGLVIEGVQAEPIAVETPLYAAMVSAFDRTSELADLEIYANTRGQA